MRIFGGFSRATAALLDTYTTIVGRSWVPILDTTEIRWRIFDGTTPGGVKMARLDEVGITTSFITSVPLSGDTITLSAEQHSLDINPADDIATLTVVLPSAPIRGRVVEINTSKTIETLTITAPGGATVSGSGQTLTAGGGMSFRYRNGDTTWIRRY